MSELPALSISCYWLTAATSRDLPFSQIEKLPDIYTTFRKSVEPLRSRPRKTLPKPPTLPPFPSAECTPSDSPVFTFPTTQKAFVDAVLKPLLDNPDVPCPPWPPSTDESASAHPFSGGESAANTRLEHLVVSGAMSSYKDTRNGLVGQDFSTKLSGYLSLGCITARQVHHAMALYEDGDEAAAATTTDSKRLLDAFRQTPGFGEGENPGTGAVRFELLWRDYMRLCAKKFGAKLFALEGIRSEYDQKVWKGLPAPEPGHCVVEPQSSSTTTTSSDTAPPATTAPAIISTTDHENTRQTLSRFLAGRTGISFVDASARELLLTGYTSNRARQNVANFLAKHLNIDWRLGAEWYESMLIDYDSPSNWGNWQYVSGVGNDPREGRIFNPVKQALDYDSKGEYIKTWVAELSSLNVFEDQDQQKTDDEKLMGLFQPWRLDDNLKDSLSLKGVDLAEEPLMRIQFSVGKKPVKNNRSQTRGFGGRRPYMYGRWRGRGRGGGPGDGNSNTPERS
jgi:deoxyribodipyrimidine photo-lyase